MSAGLSQQKIGRYELIQEIGRGSMAVVYLAKDPSLGRTIVFKTIDESLLRQEDRELYERRFLEQARAAGRLSHPGILRVHDVDRDTATGTLYLAAEHVQGRTLEAVVPDGQPLEWREALRIVGQVAAALHHAHVNGVVHRDLKPANVMIDDSGAPRIMDFGIARFETLRLQAGAAGPLSGALLYLSPEQARGEDGDARSDVFSLGALAYRLLTGRHAFAAGSADAILSRVLHEEIPLPSEVLGGAPPDASRVVARAMRKSPQDRYPDAASLAEDVEDVLAGRAPRHCARTAPSPPASPRVGDRTWFPEEHSIQRRRASLRAIIGLLLLAAVAALHFLRGEGGSRWAELPRPAPASPGAAPTPAPLVPEDSLPPPEASPAAPDGSMSSLSLDFEHSLRSGTLAIYLDGVKVLEKTLRAGAEKKKMMVFKVRRGFLHEAIEVNPGSRRVRVEVRSRDGHAADEIVGAFKAGSARRLRARLKAPTELSLEWY